MNSVESANQELSSSIPKISCQTEEAMRIISDAIAQAPSTNEQVGNLTKAADRIGDVVEVINLIVAQINLLALDPTIEAAWAGGVRKGFSVVASEVKLSASQTAKATDDISSQVSEIQQATTKSVRSFQGINETVEKIKQNDRKHGGRHSFAGAATQEIARIVSEAARGTSEVTANVVGVSEAAATIRLQRARYFRRQAISVSMAGC